MTEDQRRELFASGALSSASLKSKINMIHSKMSYRENTTRHNDPCENCRCTPPSKIGTSRTVRRILAACFISLITLLGSVSIDLSNSIEEWRNTDSALNGFSSCTKLLALHFIGFLQVQRKQYCWDNLNFTDQRKIMMNKVHSFCKEAKGINNPHKKCVGRIDVDHECGLYLDKIETKLENITNVDLNNVFSDIISDIFDMFSSQEEDLEKVRNNPDWADVMSLHLLIKAKETISGIHISSSLLSEDLQILLYQILTMFNYAIFTSNTLHSCWKDTNLSVYLTGYQNVVLFTPLISTMSMFYSPYLASDLDYVQFCLQQRGHKKLMNKCKDILSTISLKVTLLTVSCLIYPIVLVSFKQMTEWIQNYAKSLKERTEDLKKERHLAEDLLHQMLPKSVAKQLRKCKHVEAESYDQVTIFFSDVVGFTSISASCTPLQVVEMLNSLYICFDSRIESYNVYKVETIGDAYMVVSGLPERSNEKHADEIAKMSLDLVAAVRQVVIPHMPRERLQLRAGIHTGPCVAGVVGYKMPRYCLFGDTVNTASRMESTSLPQKIHISSATYQVLLIDDAYEIEPRGEIEVKSLSSNILSETSRLTTPRISEELIALDGHCLTVKAEGSTSGSASEQKSNLVVQGPEKMNTLTLPVFVRVEYEKGSTEKRMVLPGFVEES